MINYDYIFREIYKIQKEIIINDYFSSFISSEKMFLYTLETSVLLLHVNHDSNFLGIWSVYF